MTTIEEIDNKIIEDFNIECNEDLLKKMIEDFKKEILLRDCTFLFDWNRCLYRDNLYKVIRINIDNLKQKNEKKLALTIGFYSLCKDKDILENIYKNLYS